MIDAELRRAVLANFPPGTSLGVVAPADKGYSELLSARGDGAALVVLADGKAPSADALVSLEHVLLEGVDDVEDPVGLLRSVRAAAPSARLFLVIANAAYARSLLAFFDGAPLARAHPLVGSEIEPLLAAAGWRPLAINPIADESIPADQALPFELTTPNMCIKISDSAMLERTRTRAFIVIADRT